MDLVTGLVMDLAKVYVIAGCVVSGKPTEATRFGLNLNQLNVPKAEWRVTEVVQDNDLDPKWGPLRPQSQQIDISMA